MALTKSVLAVRKPSRPWPAERIEHWPIERLIPYANNPQRHSEADLDKIEASIRQWGWTIPVLVDPQGKVIAGEGRVAGCSNSRGDLNPGDRCARLELGRKARLSPGRQSTCGEGELDMDLLSSELQELGFADFHVGLIGFEPKNSRQS